MLSIFHGANKATHDAFQLWRRKHPEGFHLSEGRKGAFTAHWTQDLREHGAGRGCNHTGGNNIGYREDKIGCYTTARKVCSNNHPELITWANAQGYQVKSCSHCDTSRFPFPMNQP